MATKTTSEGVGSNPKGQSLQPAAARLALALRCTRSVRVSGSYAYIGDLKWIRV